MKKNSELTYKEMYRQPASFRLSMILWRIFSKLWTRYSSVRKNMMS